MTGLAVDDDGACAAVLKLELLDELDDPEDDADVVLEDAEVPDVVVLVAEAWEE